MSITKYKTEKCYPTKITPVECERETDKCVFVIGIYGRKEASKASKAGEYDQYHDSWEVAHAHLLGKAKSCLASHKKRVDTARSELETVKALKAPKATA